MSEYTETQKECLDYIHERKLCADAANNTKKSKMFGLLLERLSAPEMNWTDKTLNLPMEEIIELLKDSIAFQTLLWRSYYQHFTDPKKVKEIKSDPIDEKMYDHETEPKKEIVKKKVVDI